MPARMSCANSLAWTDATGGKPQLDSRFSLSGLSLSVGCHSAAATGSPTRQAPPWSCHIQVALPAMAGSQQRATEQKPHTMHSSQVSLACSVCKPAKAC